MPQAEQFTITPDSPNTPDILRELISDESSRLFAIGGRLDRLHTMIALISEASIPGSMVDVLIGIGEAIDATRALAYPGRRP